MTCKDCGSNGKLRVYVNGRVLSAYCHCSSGQREESKRDQLCRSMGSSIDTDREYRLRYAKGTPKRY